MESAFSVSFPVLIRMNLAFFVFSYKVMELSLTVHVALGLFQAIYDCLPGFFPFCSYRTRCWIILNAAAVANSGWWPNLKRRRTTKIRRLIVAWDCRVPSLLIHCVPLSHQCGHTTVLCLFPLTFSPSSVSCASAFSWRSSLSLPCGRVAYCSVLSKPRSPSTTQIFLSRNRRYPLENSAYIYIFKDILRGA